MAQDHITGHEHAAPMLSGPTGPLAGVRVIDVTQAIAGPWCAMMLGDLGADVIKVEPPAGDSQRFLGPYTKDDEEHAYGGAYATYNRNKRSIALDLADEADRETLLRLVDGADALIENSRAGVLDRLGLSYEVLHERNPKLVYGAIRGFGDPRTGASPYGDWPAYDVVAQAMGGFVATTGPDAEHPQRAGPLVGDMIPGLMASLGLVSALVHARDSGEGQFLDVAMVDALMSICESAQTTWDYLGRDLPPSGNTTEDVTPFDVYATADGQCAIAAPTGRFWHELCTAMGRQDLSADPELATNPGRIRRRAEVDAAVGGWVGSHTTAEVVAALGGKVPVGPVHGARDWATSPHVAAREMLVEVEHLHHRPTTQLGCPIKLTATPSGPQGRPPQLDEHGAELRAELGAAGDTDATGVGAEG
jgi:crotonobetainyl-CoA:carnitine CoA-transferase CaiB-like acyl-CoA transferase